MKLLYQFTVKWRPLQFLGKSVNAFYWLMFFNSRKTRYVRNIRKAAVANSGYTNVSFALR